MNKFVLEHIGKIVVGLTISLVLSGFNLVRTVGKQTVEIEHQTEEFQEFKDAHAKEITDLKAEIMDAKLINEKFKNIEENFKELKNDAIKRDEKLDKILEKL